MFELFLGLVGAPEAQERLGQVLAQGQIVRREGDGPGSLKALLGIGCPGGAVEQPPAGGAVVVAEPELGLELPLFASGKGCHRSCSQ